MDWNNINRDRDTSGLGPIEYDQTKVPTIIRKYADNVRTKTYGQEVREAQARNAEYAGLIASEAMDISNETKVRQDNVETQFNSVQKELTDKDPISAPEIIAARNGEANLKSRLDKEHQNVNAQLAQIVTNVKTFGATGDGITDDTQAIQEAIDVTALNGGGTVYFPIGEYVVTSTLKIKQGLTDSNGTDYARITVEGAHWKGSRLDFSNMIEGNGIEITGVDTIIKDISIADPPEHGFYFKSNYKSIYNLTVERAYVTNAGIDGFYFENVFMLTLERNYVYNSGRYGFNFRGQQTSLNIENNYVNGAGAAGYYVENAGYSTLKNNGSDNATIGYVLDGCRATSMLNNGSEVVENGLIIKGENTNVTIDGFLTYRIKQDDIVIKDANRGNISIKAGHSVEPISPSLYNYIKVDALNTSQIVVGNINDTPFRSSLIGGNGGGNVIRDKDFALHSSPISFQPKLSIGGDSNITYETTPSGIYRRIGNIIFFIVNLTVDNIGSLTGPVKLIGLPSPSVQYGETIAINNRNNINVDDLHLRFDGSRSTEVGLYYMDGYNINNITNVHISKGSRIMFSGCYSTI